MSKTTTTTVQRRQTLHGMVYTRPATEVLQCTIRRGEAGYGIEAEDCRGACVVRRLHGEAKRAGVLQPADRITCVAGDGPLDRARALAQNAPPADSFTPSSIFFSDFADHLHPLAQTRR